MEPHSACAFDLMWWTQSHSRVLDFGLWSGLGLGLDRVGSSPLYQAKIPKSLQELRCWESNRMCGWKGFSNSRSFYCTESQKSSENRLKLKIYTKTTTLQHCLSVSRGEPEFSDLFSFSFSVF